MTGFLIQRPIAVTMAFLGIMVLGLVAAGYLPVSLVPDVDIPRISVRVDAPGYSARQLEHTVMDRLRTHLMQVNRLKDIRSETRDGSGLISLEFDYGTNIDLAYIEINEQVDKAAAALPRDVARPAVIKASASDIPVFFLEIRFRQQQPGQDFLQLSAFADEIIRRRLEQIPQVAMADMSGRDFPEIVITPQRELLQAMGLAAETIENAIRAANVTFGNIVLRDKQYQYHVRMGNQLVDAADIGSIYLKHQERLWQLKELCHIETRSRAPEGMVFSQKKRAVSMAIIKQGDARMQDLKQQLHAQVEQLSADYPHLDFVITRDQTALLDITLSNLQQTLLLGGVLAFVVMFAFLGDPRAPWLIIVAVPAALVVSMLFFFLAGISLNVISISGLILCIGMMIDNSIIVIDNISRHRQQGLGLYDACVKGTNEVFAPLLSSVLTTCSVFIPLVFLGGLAGAMFFDQAMAVSIGLLVSLAVAMMLIPVYYHILYRNTPAGVSQNRGLSHWAGYRQLYTRGFHLVMRRQWLVWLVVAVLMAGLVLLPSLLPRERLPQMQRQAVLLEVDWNENIHVHENHRRMMQLLDSLDPLLVHSTLQAGRQQFMLGNLHSNTPRQSLLYLLSDTPAHLEQVIEYTCMFFRNYYPSAIFDFREEGNLFDQVFGDRQPPLEVRLVPLNPYGSSLPLHLENTLQALSGRMPWLELQPLPLQQTMVLEANMQLMALHRVDMSSLHRSVERVFNENQVINLVDQRNILPVKVSGNPRDIGQMLQMETVRSRDDIDVPLGLLLRQSQGQELQMITAGLEGEYFPQAMHIDGRQHTSTTRAVKEVLRESQLFDAGFSGSIFAQQELTRELLLIGAVALLLLFFILAAQFESLRLPFIVLVEVPLAMAGAMFMLWVAGASLNLMSMIGMVVMAGIIINDSILKIDTINRLRAGGMSLLRALHTAGHYRLKPILMTSITTICALLPVLFISGLGGELQKPLALAVIGGLGLGTFVSLFFIPVFYYYLFKGK
jgi:multidrug efflux pump subunit AcrB